MNRFIEHAKQTFIAMKNPYNSVAKTFPQAICATEGFEEVHYVGIKNVPQIPSGLLQNLKKHGFELHTIDQCSDHGRAVDMQLMNPLTGRKMTGSSSGTAINVFLGINDLGIGTDGGGSVLAPAMSVQCYGFISPLIETEHMKRYEKNSTDGFCFTPSLGFISAKLRLIEKAARICLGIGEPVTSAHVICPESLRGKLPDLTGTDSGRPADRLDVRAYPAFDNRREPMIKFLKNMLRQCDVLIYYEEKIDVYGYGDSILGHFDAKTQAEQLKSGKFLTRAANMAGATALCIPDKALASGFVLICESKQEKIEKLFGIANRFPVYEDELTERYFRNFDAYFSHGALEER